MNLARFKTPGAFFIGALLFLNFFRFLGLESAPPGFYVDEAVGAAQVLCLKETGADFFHHVFPLFSKGLGGGYYTAPYLYAEVVWTSLFGNSIYAFRALLALVSFLTIVLMFLWVRSRANEKLALWVAFFATISPWCFQFSRIAWDPPFSVFFLFLGLWFLEKPKILFTLLASVAFALAAYAYPPMRVEVLVLLWLLPWMKVKQKLKISALFLVLIVPLLLASLDPAFTARARMLILSSSYPMNPYRNENWLGLAIAFISQVFRHLSFDFLVLKGDANLRHSTGEFGVLSYLEAFVLVLGVLLLPKWRKRVDRPHFDLLWVSIFGLGLGIAPAALTWEGVPHALRAIGAWPFFSLLAGVLTVQLLGLIRNVKWARAMGGACLFGGVVFYAAYLNFFFFRYPEIALPWFQTEPAPVAQAYHQMVDDHRSCAEIRPEMGLNSP